MGEIDDENLVFGIITALLVLWLIALVIVCFCFCGKKKKPKPDEEKPIEPKIEEEEKIPEPIPEPIIEPPVHEEPPEEIPIVEEPPVIEEEPPPPPVVEPVITPRPKSVGPCEIDKDRLKLDDTIGTGHFGIVYKATLLDENLRNGETIAAKTIEGEDFSSNEVNTFIEDVKLMQGFDHPNVLGVIGYVNSDKPYAVMPYMPNGNLQEYVEDPHHVLNVKQLLAMGFQIAEGMEYLASQGFVHKDLAARNCMVEEDLNVKVAEFGLSRELFSSEYHTEADKDWPSAVRWMAIESLNDKTFTTKSDVWSYGIVLWELFSRGKEPYPDIQINRKVVYFVIDNKKLHKPFFAPKSVYSLMLSCWEHNPDDRPSFQQIVTNVSDRKDQFLHDNCFAEKRVSDLEEQ